MLELNAQGQRGHSLSADVACIVSACLHRVDCNRSQVLHARVLVCDRSLDTVWCWRWLPSRRPAFARVEVVKPIEFELLEARACLHEHEGFRAVRGQVLFRFEMTELWWVRHVGSLNLVSVPDSLIYRQVRLARRDNRQLLFAWGGAVLLEDRVLSLGGS